MQQLVSHVRNTCSDTLDFFEDGLRRGSPHERLRGVVVALRESPDLVHQLAHTTTSAALQCLLAEQSEPAFHLVQPRRVRWREVQMVARPLGQPALHRNVLVRGVVVQHQMDVQVRRHLLVDQPPEREELLAPVPRLALDDPYVELSLDGDWCYNPLESDLDAYSLAYQVASLLNQLFGKGKEPFWQQAYTNLVKFVILLHRLADGYVTLQDVYRTALDEGRPQGRVQAAREALDYLPEVWMKPTDYATHGPSLPARDWQKDDRTGVMRVRADTELVDQLKEVEASFELRDPEPVGDEQRLLQAVITWHRHDWSQLDARLRSSIVEGVSVFLSLFDQPDVSDVFCPPKSAYRESQPHRGRWALPPLSEALEDGKVLALNLPIGANPALGRAIGVMLKQDFQRAVLARIPGMAAEPDRPWRDIAFICDEYQGFATVGESDPGGDEKFFSLSRQARLVALVATQSISSLRSTLPGESWRTLLQTFRTRIFLTLSDEASCKLASEACGQAERLKEQYSIPESSQSGVGLLSGRAGGGKGTYGVTKSYAPRREAVFPPSDFAELRNAQAIVAAYDGVNPIRPTYCYLKPWYLPRDLPYFKAVEEGRL